jgi:hypothetical protein
VPERPTAAPMRANLSVCLEFNARWKLVVAKSRQRAVATASLKFHFRLSVDLDSCADGPIIEIK